MRAPLVVFLILGLSACTAPVPDSGASVGFQDYNSYLRQREAALASGARPPAVQPAPEGFSTDRVGAAIDAADGRGAAPAPVTPAPQPVLQSGDRPRGNAPIGIKEESGEMAGQHSTISDEQDFAAVSARETIQSDAQRRAQQAAQYEVIQPTAVPERTGDVGPNIVQFALSTTHNPGTAMYKRSSLNLTNQTAACAKYGSPDLAQEAFLAAGGPERDRKGLDQDGDGFACGWDPRPFRAALN